MDQFWIQVSANPYDMKKFAVLIHGTNYLMRDQGCPEPRLRAFYVNVFTEALELQTAESEAIEIVDEAIANRDDFIKLSEYEGLLSVDESAELYEWPEDCGRPLGGFVLYDQGDPDE